MPTVGCRRDLTAIPIRALAAGGRVPPHLGLRPPAWPLDARTARDAAAPVLPPGLPVVLRGGVPCRRGLVGGDRHGGVGARCPRRDGAEYVGAGRRRRCPDRRAGGGGGRGGRERVAIPCRPAERAWPVGGQSPSLLRSLAACLLAAAQPQLAPASTRPAWARRAPAADGAAGRCPRGRTGERSRGRRDLRDTPTDGRPRARRGRCLQCRAGERGPFRVWV
jgi:hypothetical protein